MSGARIRSHSEIRDAADKLNRSSELVKIHPGDTSFTKPWHEAFGAMYPPEWATLVAALRDGHRSAIEPAIVFLEADVTCFRSGYEKEKLCRYLGRLDLTPSERDRLVKAARKVLDGKPRPQRERRRWQILLNVLTKTT